jgi:hypothetical protein
MNTINNLDISGENILVRKDANQYKYNFSSYTITGEKIIEMYLNHEKTFRTYFANNDTITYSDVMSIYKKQNIICYGDNLIYYSILKYLNPIQIKQTIEIEKCGYVLSIWGSNYYHFITEELPNLIKLSLYDTSLPIIINTNNKYIIEFLELVKFKIKNPVIKNDPSILYKIKECYITNLSLSGKPSCHELLLAKNLLEENTLLKQKSSSEIGIIIKRTEHERKIINHDEMVFYLRTKYPSIEWIEFDSLSVVETIKLFNRAKIIIGPHGAGLTNMLFAKKGITVIEIMPYSDPNECYHHLTNMLEHKYNCIVLEDSGKINEKQMKIKMEYLDKILNISDNIS